MIKVNEFAVNQKAHGHFMVKSLKTGVSAKSKKFMDIELGDKTGMVLAKLWEISYQAESLSVGDIVYATGTVTEWQGSKQLKLDYIEKTKVEAEISEFIETVSMSTDSMLATMTNFISSIDDEEIRELVEHIYRKREPEFMEAPAARSMHHALYGGLAYHTVTMLQSAKQLWSVYPFLNRDLLYAGVILHDIAKLTEMEYANGTASGYSRSGNLIGHIVQGAMWVEEAAARLGTSERTKEALQHMILSHHEKGEWGSPKPPMMPEAMMLHFIDNIDAKMYMAKELKDNKGEGDFTDYHYGLKNKLFIF